MGMSNGSLTMFLCHLVCFLVKTCHPPLLIDTRTNTSDLVALRNRNITGGLKGGERGKAEKLGASLNGLAFTLMNPIQMEVHIKPHRFCIVILLIAIEASFLLF